MTLNDFMQHICQTVLKRNGGRSFQAAEELDVGVVTLRNIKSDCAPPDNPRRDADVLVDILREFLPQMCGDDRVAVFEALSDGYCLSCGSDAGCACEV